MENETIQQILYFADTGEFSPKQLCRMFNIHPDKVYYLLKKHEVENRYREIQSYLKELNKGYVDFMNK